MHVPTQAHKRRSSAGAIVESFEPSQATSDASRRGALQHPEGFQTHVGPRPATAFHVASDTSDIITIDDTSTDSFLLRIQERSRTLPQNVRCLVLAMSIGSAPGPDKTHTNENEF